MVGLVTPFEYDLRGVRMDPAPRLVQFALSVFLGAVRIVDALVHRTVAEALAAVAHLGGDPEAFARALDELWARLESSRCAAKQPLWVSAVALDAGARLELRAQRVGAAVAPVARDGPRDVSCRTIVLLRLRSVVMSLMVMPTASRWSIRLRSACVICLAMMAPFDFGFQPVQAPARHAFRLRPFCCVAKLNAPPPLGEFIGFVPPRRRLPPRRGLRK